MYDEDKLDPPVAELWFWRYYDKEIEAAWEALGRAAHDEVRKHLEEGRKLSVMAEMMLYDQGAYRGEPMAKEWHEIRRETELLLAMLAAGEHGRLTGGLTCAVERARSTRDRLGSEAPAQL